VGEQLGKGHPLDEILAPMLMVAEGVSTTPAVLELAERTGVEMPIVQSVGEVLDGRLATTAIVGKLMHREARAELHG
jgi:glycerol-3-phosphate dehydrogenase (NAD(P)+)